MLTEEYDAEARASEDYVHVITEDGLAVPLALGNNGVEHRQVHMMVDGQEVALKFENNHLSMLSSYRSFMGMSNKVQKFFSGEKKNRTNRKKKPLPAAGTARRGCIIRFS